ncbi:metallophosphoesterase family protein [Arthrobacter caoxuetaonis]|uniref:Metallophosphoesterase n=1 Tax=Arthrobacter caoxuetaonis TaxID=2886935 RepID=A0A9X1SDM3_9MICC|nr:metallophosphoesterase [Arthrobacter caoxuetaonis]MCC3299323.1 metallophosphoesterase [Arthrobacter caoxuetaonis]USQ59184.1 metallophosphoesterase [Arthrobacter caoxuetaonis]
MNDETNHIVLAGDWHGNVRWMQRALQRIRGAGHRKILHVGDLRVLWPESVDGPLSPAEAELIPGARDYDAFTVTLCKLLEQYGMDMLFVDGNHDNHPALRALPRDEDGFGIISDRLKYIPRGHRFSIGGVRFAGLGGAFSINKQYLTQGLNWWPEEVLTRDDIDTLGSGPVDVLLTHDVPAGIDLRKMFRLPEALERESHAGRILLRDAVRSTDPSLVFSGHWHQRTTQVIPGSRTTVHVLDMDGRGGNFAVLDLESLQVSELGNLPRIA